MIGAGLVMSFCPCQQTCSKSVLWCRLCTVAGSLVYPMSCWFHQLGLLARAGLGFIYCSSSWYGYDGFAGLGYKYWEMIMVWGMLGRVCTVPCMYSVFGETLFLVSYEEEVLCGEE